MRLIFTPLAPKAKLMFFLRAGVSLIIFWGPLLSVSTIGLAMVIDLWLAVATVGAIGLCVLLWSIWMPHLQYVNWGYLQRDEDLLVKRGVLLRSVTSIPYSRIQHVDTHQGPLELILNLARVQIYTASGMGADAVIPGIKVEDANKLRDTLLASIDGDDGV